MKHPIWTTIEELVALVEQGRSTVPENERALAFLLDKLAYQIHDIHLPDDIDEKDPEEEPPDFYPALHVNAEKHFPRFGSCKIPDVRYANCGDGSSISRPEAINDLCEIVNDLEGALWYLTRGNDKEAAFKLRLSYDTHWAQHLRCLQLYLTYLG